MTQGPSASTTLSAQSGTTRRQSARARRREALEADIIDRMKRRIATLQGHSDTDHLNLRLADLEPYLPVVDAPWEQRHRNIVLTNFLKAGIQAGVWDVDRLPDVIVRLPPDPSPFRPERMTSARAVTELKRRHEAALASLLRSTRNPRGAPEARRRAGQLLVSAIVYGGLLHRPFVEVFPERMHTHLFEHDGCLWIDFEHGLNADADDVYRSPPSIRRWFPDPLTAMLLLRWRLDGCRWPTGNGSSLDTILLSYLSVLGIALSFSKGGDAVIRFGDTEDQRISIAQRSAAHFLLEGARAHLALWVPPVLADFASRPERGCGLDAEAWVRTVTGQRLSRNPADRDEDAAESDEAVIFREAASDSPPSLTRSRNEGTQRALLRALMAGLSGARGYVRRAPARKFIEAFRQEHRAELCPVLRLLLDWSLWSITTRDIGQGRIKVSSLVRYLSAIGPGLADAGEDLTEEELRGNDDFTRLVDVCDTVVASARGGQTQPYVIDRLSEFLYYLSATLGTPAIAWRGRNIRARRRPHANVLSEREYRVIRRSIEHSRLPERRRELLALLLVCGYRLGLRRDEISGRQLNCFQGHPWDSDLFRSIRPQLWIHVTAVSSVKATASNRRSPMYHLLDADELGLFHRWAERRQREIRRQLTGTELLFTDDEASAVKLGDTGFSQISELIRKVTGDGTLDFHNLRHSFVTLTTVRLLGAQVHRRNEHRDDLPPWTLPESWTPPGKLQGSTLQKRLLLTDAVPRQALFQVAALAGHIDPKETVNTYCHGLDLLLQGYLMALTPSFDKRTLGALQGHSESAERVRRLRRRSATTDDDAAGTCEMTMAGALQHLIDSSRRKHFFVTLPATEPLRERPIIAPDPDAGPRFLSMAQCYSILLTLPSPMSLVERARCTGVRPEMVTAVIDSARHYAGEITSVHRKQKRSRAVARKLGHLHKDLHVRQQPEIIGCGRALPKPGRERREATHVYQSLMAAALADPAFIARVEAVYGTSSRSAAHLEISTAEEADSLREVLRVAGIDRARLVATVLSIPRKDGKAEFRRELARRLEMPQRSIGFAEPLRRRHQGATFGRVALKLAPTGGRTGRSPYGWKVGLFYALVGYGAASGGSRRDRRDTRDRGQAARPLDR